MVNPLSNPDGNVATRWVYQAMLVEMTDKTLYGLCATQRHKDVAGCKGINNYTLVNVLPSCTETEHSQQEVLTLIDTNVVSSNHRYLPTPHNTRTQHALATLQSGPTASPNNQTGRLHQHVFTSAPCPRFHAE